jgi:hypothetical protein
MIVQYTSDKNLLVAEVWGHKMDQLRRDLTTPGMTALEDLLVDRIITCWLDVHLAEHILAASRGDMSIHHLEWHEKRRDRVHHRFVSSVLALARARRLLTSQVDIAPPGAQQVNVAQRGAQQFNVSTTAPTAGGDHLPDGVFVDGEVQTQPYDD